jgi:hypothetical protein
MSKTTDTTTGLSVADTTTGLRVADTYNKGQITLPISVFTEYVSKCLAEIANYSSLHWSQTEIVLNNLEEEFHNIIQNYHPH